MYKLSVIIPVYNVEKYLPQCLESVAEQMRDDCQIILVDDGSTDSSGEICDSFAARSQNTVVIHQKNAGLGGARNTGILSAEGEYLMFLDSDDTLTSDAIATVYEYLDKYGADIFIYPLRSVDGSGRELEINGNELPGDVFIDPTSDKSVLTVTPCACNKVVRSSLFKDTGVSFPKRVWYEDLRTMPKLMSAAERVVSTEKVLYNYLCRQGSIMNNKGADRNAEIIEAMSDLITWFKKRGIYEKYAAEMDCLTVNHVLMDASLRVIRIAGRRHPLVKQFREFTLKNCNDLKNNPYLAAMPRNRKIIYKLLISGLALPVEMIVKVKNKKL